MAENFAFEGGICVQFEQIPIEWRPWFNLVAASAPAFGVLVEWDVACLASLLVLQLFKIGPSEFFLFFLFQFVNPLFFSNSFIHF